MMDCAIGLSLDGSYRRMLTQSGTVFVRVAVLVSSRPAPTLVHCSAGKDRTGLVIVIC
jgi:protein tyrosine/serine phosphatase